MASDDNAAERFAAWYIGDSSLVGLLVTRSSPVNALEHQCRQFESDPLRNA